MRTSLYVLISLFLLCGAAMADAVFGAEFPVTQPDGTVVTVRVWGDEFYRVVETLDGYTAVKDPATGSLCYAELSPAGDDLVSTGIPVGSAAKSAVTVTPHIRISPEAVRQRVAAARQRNAMPKQAKAAPVIGQAHGLCILIEFSDDLHTIDASEVDAFCNQPGYTGFSNNGSVRDYFHEVSDGRLTYTNVVLPQYYMAAQPRTYYENPNISGARQLVKEVMEYLDTTSFDFEQCDANGDGAADALNVYYAGYRGSEWSEGLWPHSGYLGDTYGGVYFPGYQMTDMTDSLSLRTFCHENGHMLCNWPDFYDYDYDSTGVGDWCLMGYGAANKNPCEPSAYLKGLCGWTNVIRLGANQLYRDITVTQGVNTVFQFDNPLYDREFYIVENRDQSGRDADLPGVGLLIWHIDRNGSNNWQQMTPAKHYEATVVQADGLWELENDVSYGDNADPWRAGYKDLCGPNTNPGTGWWAGGFSYLTVRDISDSGPVMTFRAQGLGSDDEDEDGDGISDMDEVRDLNPIEPGVQNPFDPFVADSTGNNGDDTPDGILDGENDYDADGLINSKESDYDTNPIDAISGVPAAGAGALALLAAALVAAARRKK